MKYKLAVIALSFCLAGSVYAGGLKYRENIVHKNMTVVFGRQMMEVGYDSTGDGNCDIHEYYNGMSIEPVIYTFDRNKDGRITKDEVLIDKAADGLNGNEIQLSELEKQIPI